MTQKLPVVFALALGASLVPAQASLISLNLLSPPQVGSSFDVAVQLTGAFSSNPGDAISSYGFNVTVRNPSVVSYTSETAGGLFTDLSGVIGPPSQVTGFATSGFLEAGDFTEPLTLAVLHFFVNGPGSSTISISADLTDLNQGLYYLDAGQAAISASTTVSPGAATPEPGTILFGGVAVIGLFLLKRKSQAIN
jgi:hypothetical protein